MPALATGAVFLVFSAFLASTVEMVEALTIVLAVGVSRQTVYDCLYIALAERERCELVTADDKLVKAVQPTLPFVLALSSLP